VEGVGSFDQFRTGLGQEITQLNRVAGFHLQIFREPLVDEDFIVAHVGRASKVIQPR